MTCAASAVATETAGTPAATRLSGSSWHHLPCGKICFCVPVFAVGRAGLLPVNGACALASKMDSMCQFYGFIERYDTGSCAT